MKCYTHHTVAAVAVCRACNRALCPDCVTEVGETCACKNRCEERVTILNAMVVRNRALQQRLPVVSIFPGLLGVIFLV